MQKTLQAVESIYINKYFDELVAARDRAQEADTHDTTLGEGQRIELLAATGAVSIGELIEGAIVVKRLKRGALIQVHNLLYYCNRYGVMICKVPAEIVFGRFNAVWGPSISYAGGPEILSRLGVTNVCIGFLERHYDYSACRETPVDWLRPAKQVKSV